MDYLIILTRHNVGILHDSISYLSSKEEVEGELSVRPSWFRLVHTMLRIYCNLQESVAFLQRNRKFPVSVLLLPDVILQQPATSMNKPLGRFMLIY